MRATILFTLVAATLSALFTSAAATEAALPLLDKHVLLKRQVADLTAHAAGIQAQEEKITRSLSPLEAAVLGQAKKGAQGPLKRNLDLYRKARRRNWIATKNGEYARKLIQRLEPRVPQVLERMKRLFKDHIAGMRSMAQLARAKDQAWHSTRMARLSRENAKDIDLRLKDIAKRTTKPPASRVNQLRARSALLKSRAAAYEKRAASIQANAVEHRRRAVDECRRPARIRCNFAIRDYLVSRHRLFTARRDRGTARKDAKRFAALAETLRGKVVSGTFVSRLAGVRAFRKLRARWLDLWRRERSRAIVEERLERARLRSDRVWARINKNQATKQAIRAAEARSSGETLPASGAEKIASEKVVYQTTLGKREPATKTTPMVQFVGPNMDPRALAAKENVHRA